MSLIPMPLSLGLGSFSQHVLALPSPLRSLLADILVGDLNVETCDMLLRRGATGTRSTDVLYNELSMLVSFESPIQQQVGWVVWLRTSTAFPRFEGWILS